LEAKSVDVKISSIFGKSVKVKISFIFGRPWGRVWGRGLPKLNKKKIINDKWFTSTDFAS
jgi:hypothetical protein